MKISGLFNSDSDVLVEHLGNLDKIDKELVKSLIGTYAVKSQLQGIGWKADTRYDHDLGKQVPNGKERWDDGSARYTNKIAKSVGRDSALEERQLTVAEAHHALTTDTDVAALVYKADGKQVMMIKHDAFANKKPGVGVTKQIGYKETASYSWVMTKAFIRELRQKPLKYPPATSKKTVLSELDDATKNAISSGAGSIASVERITQLFKTLAMREWLKANPEAKAMPKEPALPKLDFIVVHVDKQRAEVQQKRKELKKNIVPVPKTHVQLKMPGASYSSSSHNVYIKGLANHLRYRLNQHKNKKAGAFESPADMLKHFIEVGYLKKLIFMDTPYNLKDNRIDFEDLMLGPKSQGKSYIEYKSEKELAWDDPRTKAVSAEFKELAKSLASHAPPPPAWVQEKIEKMETDEEKAKELAEWQDDWARDKAKPKMSELYLKHKVEPTKILVKLVLDGGKIVPHHFEMAFDRW